MIVLDSIAALLPKSEMEKDMDAGSYGTDQAKMMSAALRRLTAANQSTVLVYINQTRDSLSMFGPRDRTSGGRAMGFYAGLRLELARGESVMKKTKIIKPDTGDEVVKDVPKGHRVLVKVAKSKVGGALPNDQASFVFDYDLGGIDPIEDLLFVGRQLGWIRKQGDYWKIEGSNQKHHGRKNFKRWLNRNPDVANQLTTWIKESIDEPE